MIRASGVVAALSVSGALLMGVSPAQPAVNRVDVSGYPPDVQAAYQVFEIKCSKCHTLAKPINSRLSADDWKSYIKKMIRRPGSGINEESARQIFHFLRYYSSVKAGMLPPSAEPPTDAGTG